MNDVRSDPDVAAGTGCPEPSLPCLLRSLREKGAVLMLDEAGSQIKYRAPKGALTELDRAALVSRREEILRFLRARGVAARPPLGRRTTGVVPSFTQEFLWRSARDSPTQNSERRVPLLLPFRNRPPAVVRAAIEAVIARHDALRYAFTEVAGSLQAVINDPHEFHVEVEPLAAPCRPVWEEMAPQVAEFVSGVPPLDGKWLTRARVFLGPDEAGLIALVFHHIVGDGTSLGIIARELSLLLESESEEERLPPCSRLSASELQFSDFAAWERAWFRDEVTERLAAFWIGWLAAVPPLRLPATGAALAWAPGDRVDYSLAFGGGALHGLDELARELKVTPFLLILAVFSIALSRWSGQWRYAILSVADGRIFPDAVASRGTVGPIFHLDPIEIALPGSLELRGTLRMLEAHYAAARELRFPLNDCLSGIRVSEIIHPIAATINYRDLRSEDPSPARTGPAPGAHGPSDLLLPRPEPTMGDRYDVPLQPINLRIEHRATSLAGRLEFNEALVSRADQRAIVGRVLEAFEELSPSARQPTSKLQQSMT